MNQDLINKVLFLTHDQWNKSRITAAEKESHKQHKKDFEVYLKLFMEREPECIKDLETIVEYGNNPKEYMINYNAVKELLKTSYKETHNSIITRMYSKAKKEGRYDE